MKPPSRIGKYELLEFLGGGMSHVYRARDTLIDRIVAVKVLPGTSDQASRERFLQEARVAGNLSHPNIVRIYDYGESDGQAYLVMEFLEGETLGDALRSSRAGDMAARVRIAIEIAEALKHVHSQRLVHRDIKPENVFLSRDGRVLLLDFGIAKSDAVSLTQSGFGLGTPHYLAPEQLRGGEISAQTDIYSFGILLYELLAGRRPFEGQTVAELFVQMLNQPLQLDPLRQAGVPQELIDLIVFCTGQDPAARPSGFEEVLKVLRTGQRPTPEPVPVTASPPSQALGPASFPWRLVAAVAAVGALLLVISWLAIRPLHPPTLGGNSPEPQGQERTHEPPIAALALAIAVSAAGVWAYLKRSRRSAEVALPPSPPPPGEKAAAAAAGASTHMFRLETHGQLLEPPSPSRESTVMFTVAPGPPSDLPDASLAVIRSDYPAALALRAAVTRTPFRIGRRGADLDVAPDPAVSGSHVEINFADGGFTIRDLGSANGTFVDGRRLAPQQAVPLLFGSVILLGSNTEIAFVSADMEEMPDLAGQTVAGRFRLKQKLHGSTKSAVYVADDGEFEQPAAVKILSPRLARHPGYRQQFDREAKMASKLRHAGICRVISYGETALTALDAKTLYVAFEYLDGGSLAQKLARSEPCEADTAAGWLESLCAALDHVHGKEVVHGGIKPSVIVFDAAGNPYLTDFAIAGTRGDKEHRVVIGAPAYLAPEQWEGAAPVPASDQYSLAVVAYQVLTGSPPFEGQENPHVRKRNLARGAVPAHEVAARNGRPAFPAAVSTALARAMSSDASQRYPTATEFAAAFRGALKAAPAKPYVFLSYQRATSGPWALLFKNELERQFGYDVFLDVGQRDTAGRFPRKIEQAISRCSVFVCILGETTLASEWVLREIELASAGKKPMVPVFQEGFQHPRDTAAQPAHVQDMLTYDGVKLLDRQNIYVEATIKSLAEAIRQSTGA